MAAEGRDVDETAGAAMPALELSEFPELLKAAAEKGQPRCRNLLKKLGKQGGGRPEDAGSALKDIAREAVACIAQMPHKTRYQSENIARDICLLTGVIGNKEPLDAILELGAEGPGSVLLGAIHMCDCNSLYRNATAEQLMRLMDKVEGALPPPRVIKVFGNLVKRADNGVVQAMAGRMLAYVSDKGAEVPTGAGSFLLVNLLGRLGKEMPAEQVELAFKMLGRTILAEGNATRLDAVLVRAASTARRGRVEGGFEESQRKEIAKHVLELPTKRGRMPMSRLNHLSEAVGFEAVVGECAERPRLLKLLPACNAATAEDLEVWVGVARGALSTEELLSGLGKWATARRCRGYRAARELGKAWADAVAEHSEDADLPSRIAKLAAACSGKSDAAEPEA